MNGRSGRRDDEGKKGGKKGSKGSTPDWYGDRDEGGTRNNPKAKAKASRGLEPDIATLAGSKGMLE